MATNKFLSQELHPNPQTETEIETKRRRKSSSFLPIDIVTRIISRLCAKSVARFRCVSKQWYQLTHEPYFLNLQYERGSTLKLYRICGLNTLLSYDFELEGQLHSTKRCSEIRSVLEVDCFSNYVRGLTCAFVPGFYPFQKNFAIYILNPTTEEYLELPAPIRMEFQGLVENDHTKDLCCEENFDLGIDESTGEFKVVKLTSYKGSLYCEVLTVGTGLWRRLGELPFERSTYPAVFFDGALYWFVLKQNSSDEWSLLKFDIKEETFGSPISIPESSCDFLGEYRGHLYMLTETNEELFEAWTLRDYVNQKWIKEYSFSYHDTPAPSNRLLGFIGTADNKIIFQYDEDPEKWSSYCFDPHSKLAHKLFDEEILELSVHRESLISPLSLLGARTSGTARRITTETHMIATSDAGGDPSTGDGGVGGGQLG